MTLTVPIEIFLDALHRVARSTQKNPQLPVLSCVLFETTETTLTLKATNLEISTSITLTIKDGVPGTCALPATPLIQSMQGIRSGMVTFTKKDTTVSVSLPSGNASIKTIPADDFPEFGVVEEKETLSLDGGVLSHAFKSVLFAASPSMIRPELSSVYIGNKAHTLVLVATDSFRLVEKKIALDVSPVFESLMIPAKNMHDILSILPEGPLTFTFSEHNARFSVQGVSVITRLTSGSFPDYTQILPKDFIASATVLTKDLLSAVKRVTVFSDSFQKITLSVDPKKKMFSILAKNNDIGESIEHVEGALTGEAITIHINHRYLVDVFQALSTDSVKVSFVGEGRPILLEGVGDTSFLYLVMPMNR